MTTHDFLRSWPNEGSGSSRRHRRSAQNHDLVFYTLLYVMAFFFFLVVAIMLTFVVLYRRRKGQTARRRPHAQHAAGNLLDRDPAGRSCIGFFVARPAVLRRSRSAAGGRRRRGRRGQPMAVQLQISQRGRIERTVSPGRSAGGAEAHLQGRHPRPLHPGLPRAAQCRAGAEHGDLVPADGAYRQGPATARRISITSSARSTAATAMPK